MLVAVLLASLAAVSQGPGGAGSWVSTPAAATVGDTVWVARSFTLPPGWRLRPGRLEETEEIEALGDPVVVRRGSDWVVRYPVTAWAPGAHHVELPSLWRLGPDGQADSVAGGSATFELQSVIPPSDTAPVARPAVAPLRTAPRNPLFALLGGVLAAGGLATAWWWRRRAPRRVDTATPAAAPAETGDTRWIASGEPRAVATRAAGRLRRALARAVPEAHQGLPTAACVEIIRRTRPAASVDELQAVLEALDREAFAKTPDGEIETLARRAEAMAEGWER
jgi:hypothetical protein